MNCTTNKKIGKKKKLHRKKKTNDKIKPMTIKECKHGHRGPHQKARAVVSEIFSVTPVDATTMKKTNVKEVFVKPSTSYIGGLGGNISCVEVNWDCESAPQLKPPEHAQSVINFTNGNFRVIDGTDQNNSVAVFAKEKKEKKFLFYKASQRQRNELKKKWTTIRKLIPLAFQRKPDVVRGKHSGARYKRYVCFGWRKNPKGKTIGEYAFKTPARREDNKISECFRELSGCLETMTSHFGKHLKEAKVFDNLQQSIGLPKFSTGGRATQFSMGLEYWSVAHTDDDYYHTTLSCLSQKEEDHDKILYYFVFPAYQVAVPLKSGDILFFNPTELHCCSNPSTRDALIFSSYVSAKTCNTQYASIT